MIKNLRLKFVLVFLVLAVSVITVSSCYAMTVESAESLPFSVEDIYSNVTLIDKFTTNCGYVPTIDNTTLVVYYSNNTYYSMIIDGINHNYIYNGSGYKYYYGYLNSITGGTAYRVVLKGAALSYSTGSEVSTFGEYLFASDSKIYNCTNIAIYNDNGNTLIYEPAPKMSVDVTHEFKSDMSAKVLFDYSAYGDNYVLKYSLSGIEVNMDLTAPITLKNPVTYNPSLTNLVVAPNTKVYWVLYDSSGNSVETDVYQVPEYDAVIENSDKKIEYEIIYNEDKSSAVLKATVTNALFSDKLYYTEYGLIANDFEPKIPFPISNGLTVDHNCNLNLILYDSFGNIISVNRVTIDELSTIPEQNFKVNVITDEKTVILYPRLYNILQDDFYDIEYTINVDSWTSNKNVTLYEDGDNVGNIFDLTTSRTCYSNSELKFYQHIGTSNITVTFKVLNAETGEICITRTVSFKIGLDSDSTGVTGSTTNGNNDNSFIMSDNSFTGGGYSNVSWKDITSIINTNGDFWQIIKAILSCFPAWITAPIFFFISAVVTICITKMVLSIVGNLVG